ncbi:hypothetical protein [Thalassospira sp. CH_XMU1448-2]|uniref:hypothetical protein n=1 Tax=Thalassospira sp. CH_XMU1448-2 TaxID=3107773 RepID=UPI00300ACBBC
MINAIFQLGRNTVTWTRENWPKWPIAVAAIIGLPAMFMSIDNACSPISNGFCRQWLSFQWETIVAGLLGLGGGYLALTAVKWQDTNQQRRTIDTCRKELVELRTLIHGAKNKHKAISKELGDALEICRLIEQGDDISPVQEHYVALAQQNKPQEIDELVNDMLTIQDTVKQITLDFRTVISLINRVGLNRHVSGLPLKAYQSASTEISNFENIYFAENGMVRGIDERRAMITSQLSFMHLTVHGHLIGSTNPTIWHIDKVIRDLDGQIRKLARLL